MTTTDTTDLEPNPSRYPDDDIGSIATEDAETNPCVLTPTQLAAAIAGDQADRDVIFDISHRADGSAGRGVHVQDYLMEMCGSGTYGLCRAYVFTQILYWSNHPRTGVDGYSHLLKAGEFYDSHAALHKRLKMNRDSLETARLWLVKKGWLTTRVISPARLPDITAWLVCEHNFANDIRAHKASLNPNHTLYRESPHTLYRESPHTSRVNHPNTIRGSNKSLAVKTKTGTGAKKEFAPDVSEDVFPSSPKPSGKRTTADDYSDDENEAKCWEFQRESPDEFPKAFVANFVHVQSKKEKRWTIKGDPIRDLKGVLFRWCEVMANAAKPDGHHEAECDRIAEENDLDLDAVETFKESHSRSGWLVKNDNTGLMEPIRDLTKFLFGFCEKYVNDRENR